MDEVSAVFHLPINEAAKEVSLNLKESRARFEKRRGRRARVDGFDFLCRKERHSLVFSSVNTGVHQVVNR